MNRKRLFDLLLLLPVLPFAAALVALLAAAVRVFDGAPVFFLQERAGTGQRPFRIFKLRTLTQEANPADRRATRLGAFLRKRGLDELPQLFNVLRGEMSLVGPRPLSLEDARRLVAAHPPFASRFELPPGLTGPAQVVNLRGVHRTAEVEAAYAETRSAPGDLGILLRTVWINLFGKPKATDRVTRRPRWHWLRVATWSAIGGILFGWLGLTHELNRLHQLKEQGGAAAFRPLDLVSVSLLNVVMALGGYVVGYSEVADETLLLFVPSANGERSFQSDFALRSAAVRTASTALIARLDRGEAHPTTSVSLERPLAVRLAFSVPFDLSAERRTDGQVAFNLHTHITYPQRAIIPLGPGPTGEAVVLDEGIFWVLQQRGWFHPYWANWHWSVSPEDPRLAVRDDVPTVREAATVGVWRFLAARADGP